MTDRPEKGFERGGHLEGILEGDPPRGGPFWRRAALNEGKGKGECGEVFWRPSVAHRSSEYESTRQLEKVLLEITSQ